MSRASRARQRREEARLNVKVWHPAARDLSLPYVPVNLRPHIRKRLSPWLANLTHALGYRMGVQGGHCWEVAQGLTLTARADDVKYVEGVWSRIYELEDGEQPAAHAWVTVEGHRVDLVGEFYGWRIPGDEQWDYEPLKEYSHQELAELFTDLTPEGFSVSNHLWRMNGGYENDGFELPDHLKHEPEFKTQVSPPSEKYPNGLWGTPAEEEAWEKFIQELFQHENSIVFKHAVDRLLARYKLEHAS